MRKLTNPNPLVNTDGDSQTTELKRQIALRDFRIEELEILLNEVYNSRTWKLALIIQKGITFVYPPDSLRRRLGIFFYKSLLKLMGRSRSSQLALYQEWIRNNEATDGEKVQLEKRNEIIPLISIVTPVYKTPPHILRSTIDSVLAQTYPNWEMCIVNASPESEEIAEILDEYSKRDERIKIISLEHNSGIAANTNAGISVAKGEFIALLDHDDLLAPHALFTVVKAIQSHPQSDLLYSDEDKISADGATRFYPFFKPAFSPEYLRAINYICHFLVIRKSLGDSIGWLRTGFEGAQDYDLILRIVEQARFVTHIPQVLYHWRVISGSTAQNANAKNYASESGIKALGEHLQRLDIKGQVLPGPYPTLYRINYSLSTNPLVSIIIPNHNHENDIKKCVDSIFKRSSYRNFEVLIIENNSTSADTFDYYEEIKNNPGIKLLEYNHPFNFSEINNFAVPAAQGSVLLFLNNDTEVINADWLEQMLGYVLQPEVGAVGAKLYYPDNSIQHAGVIIGMGGIAGHSHKGFPKSSLGDFGRLGLPQNFCAVTAACLMIRKDVFYEIDGFDPAFQLAFGDIDLCLKVVEKGYRIIWTPYTELYHYESKTRGQEDKAEKIERFESEKRKFQEKWYEIIKTKDPYYNPNLTLINSDYSIDPSKKLLSNLLPRSLPGLLNKE